MKYPMDSSSIYVAEAHYAEEISSNYNSVTEVKCKFQTFLKWVQWLWFFTEDLLTKRNVEQIKQK